MLEKELEEMAVIRENRHVCVDRIHRYTAVHGEIPYEHLDEVGAHLLNGDVCKLAEVLMTIPPKAA